MDFKLVEPCKDCPFRKDIRPFLTKERVKDIWKSLTEKDMTFSCHKTVDYTNLEDYEEDIKKVIHHKPKKGEQHCAGALILLKKEQAIFNNVLFRLAVMGKMLNLTKLKMDAPVFDSVKDMIGVMEN